MIKDFRINKMESETLELLRFKRTFCCSTELVCCFIFHYVSSAIWLLKKLVFSDIFVSFPTLFFFENLAFPS